MANNSEMKAMAKYGSIIAGGKGRKSAAKSENGEGKPK